MPGLSGYELARRVRAELGQEILLVALTSYGTTNDAIEATRAGFDHHLTKPVDIKELIRVIEVARTRHAVLPEVRNLKSA